ncbi:MAG: NADH-quinone oxidoreductase subunit A [Pirellulales bacterium]|nr:NADH-quinone oxidoreductase subunit A [Pirellulales bacterium]
MATPTAIAAYVTLFALTGFLFLFVNLVIGWLVRPRKPNTEKLEVYECGEPTIGSSFVQFDLRFYVVALLFIIFDVEVAFFFPWAAVYGKATQLAGGPPSTVIAQTAEGTPLADPAQPVADASTTARLAELGFPSKSDSATKDGPELREAARGMALMSFADIGVFFFVLLVGFAYVWKRGDLDWVRALSRDRPQPASKPPTPRALEPSQSILSV